MKKIVHYFYVVSTLLAFAGVLWMVWSLFFDGQVFRKPLEIRGEITTEKMDYVPGEMVRATFSFCKHRNLPAVVQWQLVDTYLKVYPSRVVSVPTGCRMVITEIEVIPKDSFSGKYRFEALITYQVNQFIKVSVPIKTNDFYVKNLPTD